MLSIYRLPNQLPGERVLQVIRRSFFIITAKALAFGLFVLLPPVAYLAVWSAEPAVVADSLRHPFVAVGVSVYYLFLWAFFSFAFVDYYLDAWIITSERLIDIRQQGFFSRIIAEQKLSRIQDVTSVVNGILPTMLDFGDVHVQTAGETQRFFLHQIPRPNHVRDMIIKLVEEQRGREATQHVTHNTQHSI